MNKNEMMRNALGPSPTVGGVAQGRDFPDYEGNQEDVGGEEGSNPIKYISSTSSKLNCIVSDILFDDDPRWA